MRDFTIHNTFELNIFKKKINDFALVIIILRKVLKIDCSIYNSKFFDIAIFFELI